MRTDITRLRFLSALACGSTLLGAGTASAVNPLEYPDNGAAQFSRGGAWLALANEPIAAHYNPAALAIQGNGVSIEQQLNFNHVCYERLDKNGQPEGPLLGPAKDGLEYLPACAGRASFPSTIPSMSVALRVSKRVGIGFAIVPPATYGTPQGTWKPFAEVFNRRKYDCLASGKSVERCGGTDIYQQGPAPYRYQQLDQLSLIVFPTLGIGVEVLPGLRFGAAFISGIAVFNTTSSAVMTEASDSTGDHADVDTISRLRTKDLFVPGAILSAHWSPTPFLDVAAWGRWISAAESSQGNVSIRTYAFNDGRGQAGEAPYSTLKPICRQATCPASTAPEDHFGNTVFRKFRFPYPPEVRVGVRFHLPRVQKDAAKSQDLVVENAASVNKPSADPLHDDIFDIELDGSYTMNSSANTIEVRFVDNNGKGSQKVNPQGFVPPNADRWNGYINSYGVRLGGQVNVIPDKFAVRAGTWFETRSQEAEWLNIGVVGGVRGGVGGGIVWRQGMIDISGGYQHHWMRILDNNGNGLMRAPSGASAVDFDLKAEPPGTNAATRQQFRTYHTVNDGRMSQSAHAFTLGGTVHF